MELRLTILCENSISRPGQLLGEHGFACLVETDQTRLLFDCGQGFGLVGNAVELGCALERCEGIVLSHGHYDHAGGLLAALAETGPVPVHAHPDIFQPRYWQSNFELRPIGIPSSLDDCRSAGAQFVFDRKFHLLAPRIWITGEIPRCNQFEGGDPHLVVPDGDGYRPDPFADDQALVIETRRGLVVLLGCAHAGVINTLDHVREQTGCARIHAIVGGTHLGPASEDQYQATVKALRGYCVERLAVSHCTGLVRAAHLHHEFAGRFSFAAVGSQLEF